MILSLAFFFKMQKVVENKPRIKKVLREILVAVFSNGERES
jgi:ribosome-associated protein YbcJ (S4-like RNA binding protein)